LSGDREAGLLYVKFHMTNPFQDMIRLVIGKLKMLTTMANPLSFIGMGEGQGNDVSEANPKGYIFVNFRALHPFQDAIRTVKNTVEKLAPMLAIIAGKTKV
jgi:hypothetical protein